MPLGALQRDLNVDDIKDVDVTKKLLTVASLAMFAGTLITAFVYSNTVVVPWILMSLVAVIGFAMFTGPGNTARFNFFVLTNGGLSEMWPQCFIRREAKGSAHYLIYFLRLCVVSILVNLFMICRHLPCFKALCYLTAVELIQLTCVSLILYKMEKTFGGNQLGSHGTAQAPLLSGWGQQNSGSQDRGGSQKSRLLDA